MSSNCACKKQQRFVERNPERDAPRYASNNRPTSREPRGCSEISQCQFCTNCHGEQENEQRLMIRTSEFHALHEYGAQREKQQHQRTKRQPHPSGPAPEP